MLTKIAVLTVALMALLLGANAAGIINLNGIPNELGLSDKIEHRHIMIGVDITTGREGELPKDFEAIQRLIGSAQLGDMIDVFLIDSRSEAAQEAIFSMKMPVEPGPMGMVLARAQQSANKSFADCWNKKINSFLTDKNLVEETDLFGFFRFVSERNTEELNDLKKKDPIYLIVFTDAQEVGDGFNFERTIPGKGDLIRAKEAGLIPNLSGVKVNMLGVTPTHNISNDHWRKLVLWWRAYLQEAGAEILSITSERTLS